MHENLEQEKPTRGHPSGHSRRCPLCHQHARIEGDTAGGSAHDGRGLPLSRCRYRCRHDDAGALAIALAIGESLPGWRHLAVILLLGYVAYGLSIYCYTYAQRTIGAARTSTYYALAPFIGALLSILLLGEPVTLMFTAASLIMAVGCWIAAK